MFFLTEQNIDQTFALMKGIESLPDVFQKLTDWVCVEYEVDILNILYDTSNRNRPIMSLIVPNRRQHEKICNGYTSIRDDRADSILRKFVDIYHQASAKLDVTNPENTLIKVHDFENELMNDTQKPIPVVVEDRIEKMNDQIWRVKHLFNRLDIFFYTEEQVNDLANDDLKERIKEDWANLLKESDRYDYFPVETLKATVRFFSKEEIDHSYKGNLFFFYR